MANSLLIRGGRIIDPSQEIDMTGSLMIKEGKIIWLGTETPPEEDYAVMDAEGLIVCPGFVDMHCHLRQPGYEDRETIRTATMAAAKGGFTTLCAMPNTNPPMDSVEVLNEVRTIAAKEGIVRVWPIGCVTVGRKGEELADLSAMETGGGAVGFSDDGSPVSNNEIMKKALEYSAKYNRPIIDHCENMFMTQGGQINEGLVSMGMGLRGMPASAEELMIKRDIDLLREVGGGHLHIAHVSTATGVDLIRAAKEEGLHVTAEVTPHHLTLTEDDVKQYGTLAKVNPPLRTKADTLALLRALNDAVIDIIATDHAPHTAADKKCVFQDAAFGISGLETALGSLVSLIFKSELTLNNMIAALTVGPAHTLGYQSLGTFGIGAPADICIFDLHKEWVVDPEKFASKGKNTPLAGRILKGKVMGTFYMGSPVYADDTVLRIRDRYEI
jgi:dihydroorotase